MKKLDNVVCIVYYMDTLYNKSVKAKKNPVYMFHIEHYNNNRIV